MAGLGDYPVAGVLRAENFNRARTFYTEVLGLAESQSMGPGGAMFTAGAGSMVMIYERPGMPAPENTVLGFGIPADEFDELIAYLRSKGISFEDYDIEDMGIKTVNGIADMGGSKGAWFKDSEGNILSIATM